MFQVTLLVLTELSAPFQHGTCMLKFIYDIGTRKLHRIQKLFSRETGPHRADRHFDNFIFYFLPSLAFRARITAASIMPSGLKSRPDLLLSRQTRLQLSKICRSNISLAWITFARCTHNSESLKEVLKKASEAAVLDEISQQNFRIPFSLF